MSAHPSFLAGRLPGSDYLPPPGARVTVTTVLRAIQDYGTATEARALAETPEGRVLARRQVTTAYMRCHELLCRLENDPDGDARQRVESRQGREPTGVDGSKVAETEDEGNSGRNGSESYLSAWTRRINLDEDGIWYALMAADERGQIELDRFPEYDEAEAEVRALRADAAELRACIDHARAGTGPWAPERIEAEGLL